MGDFELNVPGTFNVTNAVFSIIVALNQGISVDIIKNAISAYKGISGRFERIGFFDNKEIYADYAHHPTAIRASINAMKMFTGDSVTVVFKPHTFSRTRALFEDFANALSLADNVILTEIYAAREEKIDGVTSEKLASLIGTKAVFCRDDDVGRAITNINHGVVILMGAGDFKVIKKGLF